MGIKFDDNGAFKGFMSEINEMVGIVEGEKKKIIQKGAKIIKANVEKVLPKSDLDERATNYDGTPYKHMEDDVKITIKDDKIGNIAAIIHGGKYTAYKWHLLDSGASDREATHFIDKALKESDSDIGKLLDDTVRKITD